MELRPYWGHKKNDKEKAQDGCLLKANYRYRNIVKSIGLFMLSELENEICLRAELWLFRDDGLGVSNDTPRK